MNIEDVEVLVGGISTEMLKAIITKRECEDNKPKYEITGYLGFPQSKYSNEVQAKYREYTGDKEYAESIKNLKEFHFMGGAVMTFELKEMKILDKEDVELLAYRETLKCAVAHDLHHILQLQLLTED